MRIRTKLYILTACALALVLLVSGTIVWTTRAVNRDTAENQAAQDIIRNLFELGILTSDYLLHEGQRGRIQWEQKHRALARLVEDLSFRGAEDRQIVRRIREETHEVGVTFAALVASRDAIASAGPEAAAALKQRYMGQLATRTQAIVSDAGRLGRRSAERVVEGRRRASAVVAGAVVILAGFMVAVCVLFDRGVVRPIRELQRGTEVIGTGRLDHKVGRAARNEIGQLSRAFDAMTERLTQVTVSRDELAGEIAVRKRVETELRMAKQAAEASNRAKSQFLTNMSHELRTPLNAVIGFANILAKNREGRLRAGELSYLDRIVANGKHLLFLINQILDLAKIEAHKVQLEWRTVDLRALVVETLDQLEAQAEAKGLRLSAEIPDEVAPFVTDETKLRQILINLVGNALKFTEHGHVTVSVALGTRGGLPCRIDVRDTGIGIPPERLGAIFEAFQQADSGTARQYGGTGLGLTISRALCELLGYRLEVSSELGRGSTFSIAIPPAALDHLPETAPAPGAGEGPLAVPAPAGGNAVAGRRVLVIDDEADARMLLTHFIEGFGCQVMVANSGQLGLQMARAIRPDVITLDLLMPAMDGWEVLRELRSDPALKHIPVIVVSIVAQEHRGTVLGAIDVLEKPVAREDLLASLEKSLRPPACRVLVVDDNEEDRKLLACHLEGSRYAVRTAASGREALAALEQEPPDVVVLDLVMPEMDGVTLLHHLRADERFALLPAIIVTARHLTPDEKRLLQLQTAAILSKTGDLESRLHEALRRLLPGAPA